MERGPPQWQAKWRNFFFFEPSLAVRGGPWKKQAAAGTFWSLKLIICKGRMRYFRYQPPKSKHSYTVAADEGRNAKKGRCYISAFIVCF